MKGDNKVFINPDICGWMNGSCGDINDGVCHCDCDTEGGDGKCMGCAEVCPVEAIIRNVTVIVDHDMCTLCGQCIEACPYDAITFTGDMKVSF